MKKSVVMIGLLVYSLALFLHCGEDSPTQPGNRADDNGPLFYSEIMEDYYKIYVSLPENHARSSELRCPVVYMLDGDWYFQSSNPHIEEGGVVGIVSRLSSEGLMSESIVVGIGYPGDNMRGRDFLREHENFYRFLTEELIPHIDEVHPADAAAGGTLIGHSDGGYFAMNAFLQHDPQADNPIASFISIGGDFSKLYVNLYN